MWKTRKEDELPGAAPTSTTPDRVQAAPPRNAAQPSDMAHLGKSLVIHGEVSGSEDLFADGEIQGSIDLREHMLVIGPHGKVQAQISARHVVVQGSVQGNITAERVELKQAANVVGDIVTQRITMEDGAYLKGSVDVHKENVKPEVRREAAAPAFAGSAPSSEYTQPSLVGSKKG
jgi:cytoskeletal protein CcmA (bactofilin family)